MKNSGIERTDHTFNPWIGCTKVSPGCKNCYAEHLMDHRLGRAGWGAGKPRVRTSASYWRQPLQWNAEAVALGVRKRVFCASLADWLDDDGVPIEWLGDLLELIYKTMDGLDWLLLTKRPDNFRARMEALAALETFGSSMARLWLKGSAAPNVCVGASAENQEYASKRVPPLLKIPAKYRFLSCEPLLGYINTRCLDEDDSGYIDALAGCVHADGRNEPASIAKIDWVIVGGESGKDARPMNPDWARRLRDQCTGAGVAFFFKQWGEWLPADHFDIELFRSGPPYTWALCDGTVKKVFNAGEMPFARVGKKAAGRKLDGREWNELPGVVMCECGQRPAVTTDSEDAQLCAECRTMLDQETKP